MKKVYNKLVRDKIPDLIEKDGRKAITTLVQEEERQKRLDDKLIEEVHEFLASHDIEEIADILEVLHAQTDVLKADWQDMEALRLKKKARRGAFAQGIVLIEVEEEP